jgi:hypothetical protein
VLVVGAVAVALGPSPVSAVAVQNYQAVPVVDWIAPGTEPLDGIGQWVYVPPIPAPGPGQLPTTGYVYGPTFLLGIGGPNATVSQGTVGLSTDAEGPIAGIQVITSTSNEAPITIRYDWSPGKLYYLVAYHLGDRVWGAWVYDHAASVWTFIGSQQAYVGSGLLRPESGTAILGAEGTPIPAFHRGTPPIVAGPCTSFPRVDAYFFPPIGYRGTTLSEATLDLSRPALGHCPTETTVEDGWVHFRLGSPAAG